MRLLELHARLARAEDEDDEPSQLSALRALEENADSPEQRAFWAAHDSNLQRHMQRKNKRRRAGEAHVAAPASAAPAAVPSPAVCGAAPPSAPAAPAVCDGPMQALCTRPSASNPASAGARPPAGAAPPVPAKPAAPRPRAAATSGGPGGPPPVIARAPEESADPPTASQDPAEKELTCAVCLEIFYEPVSTLCGHNFCRLCFLKHVMRNDAGSRKCPLCRASLPPGETVPDVNRALWATVRTQYASRLAPRKAQRESEARALEFELEMRRLRAEMREHESALKAAAPDYFVLLEAELGRPRGEIHKCKCEPVSFVCVRRRAKKNNRLFLSCPFARPAQDKAGRPKGCGKFEWLE